ncbi:MAG: hypothetical protein LC747_08770 [Acidobacteria bacterium]|nr:hypothetical protein [Acidobacteriota bacterium]
MSVNSRQNQTGRDTGRDLTPGRILVAFEKLFGGGRGVQKFTRSGLRYVRLADDALLVEQNPKKKSEWGELARAGHRVAWVMREGEYLARVVDGEVVMLD